MPLIYWIHYPEHTDPLTEGYIGISQDLDTRLAVHKRNAAKNPIGPKDEALISLRADEIIVETIFKGTASDCADEEYRLRPTKNIGWNISQGGKYNRRTAIEKLERRFKRGDLSKHQYERELDLLIGKFV